MEIDIHSLTIAAAHEHLKNKDFTVADLVAAFKTQAEKRNGSVNAYLEFFDTTEAVARAQKMYDEGRATPLTGMPFAMKDNILIKGQIASASSKMLETYKATYDSAVTEKLKEAGVVFVGRTNMDEFAMGGSTETSAFGVTRNPHDEDRVPGGSSGGSAAAVAMDGAIAALGTDTGGSIRQPASLCGVVGLKPTFGSVSRFGLIAMGSSLDQAGPIAKSVTDAELIYNTIAGHDVRDGVSLTPNFFPKKSYKGSKPVIGIPTDVMSQKGIDPSVRKVYDETIQTLKDKGYEVKEVTLPHVGYALAVYYILMPAEVSSNMARYDGLRFGSHVDGADMIADYFKSRGAGFGKEVRRRIILGTYVLSAGYADEYYYKAQALRRLIRQDFAKAWEDVDVIMTPTAPTPAFKIGEKMNDPVSMYLADVFTVTANIASVPAISVPVAKAVYEGRELPVGMQFTADFGQENTLFEIGKDLLNEIQ